MSFRPARGVRIEDRAAAVCARLTERDRFLCRLLDDHRILTSHQLAQVAFDSPVRARQRLIALVEYRLVTRFRPYRPTGSAPFHYLLDDLGLAVVAAERGLDLASVASRRRRTLLWAQSQRLAHLVGVNGFFCALLGAARRSKGRTELVEWWSEARCRQAMGGLVQPDGYGVWTDTGTTVEFSLEHDRGSEPLARLRDKLAGYEALESATGVRRWVLFHFPTPRREVDARRALRGTQLPIATSAAPLGPPDGSVWLPLHAEPPRRIRLAELPVADRNDPTQGDTP